MNPIVDTNITLARWPFRRMPGDEVPQLVAKLKANGVTQAWAGTFEGVFHRDLTAANERLKQMCQDAGPDVRLVPFGSINPLLPDWETDLNRCVDQHHMPGIRLHPNYHGYSLDHPELYRLLTAASERKLIVQIVALLEDERTQPALMQVPHVDLRPLPETLKRAPELRVELLNAFRVLTVDKAGELAGFKQLYLDIAMLEGVNGVARLMARFPAEQILFGSHFPLFYFESSLFKMRESELAQIQRDLILSQNARRLLDN